MNYAADSGYKSIEALFQSPQTQIYQKTSPENDPKPPALPPMDELKRKAAQLQELMNASVVITKEQQVRLDSSPELSVEVDRLTESGLN